jgi:hypothetical protein
VSGSEGIVTGDHIGVVRLREEIPAHFAVRQTSPQARRDRAALTARLCGQFVRIGPGRRVEDLPPAVPRPTCDSEYVWPIHDEDWLRLAGALPARPPVYACCHQVDTD